MRVTWLEPIQDLSGVPLPSGESASDLVEGRKGASARLAGHFLGRAALLALGLGLAGVLP